MCSESKFGWPKLRFQILSVSKVIDEKPLGGWLDPPPPLDQEGLKEHVGSQHKFQFPRTVTHAKACRQLRSFVVRLNRATLQTPVY